MKESYSRKAGNARVELASSAAQGMIISELEELARDGARRILQQALEAEVTECSGSQFKHGERPNLLRAELKIRQVGRIGHQRCYGPWLEGS